MPDHLTRILALGPRYVGPKKGLLRTVWIFATPSAVALCISIYLSKDNRGSDNNAELLWAFITFILLWGSVVTSALAAIFEFVLLLQKDVPIPARISGLGVVAVSWSCTAILFSFLLHGKLPF
jgi:hypothetical protein